MKNEMNINKTFSSEVNILTSLMTVLFVGLKLTGYINWSWWWVLAPLWIPVCIALILLLGILVVYFIKR